MEYREELKITSVTRDTHIFDHPVSRTETDKTMEISLCVEQIPHKCGK